jgi:hypothetical protein
MKFVARSTAPLWVLRLLSRVRKLPKSGVDPGAFASLVDVLKKVDNVAFG